MLQNIVPLTQIDLLDDIMAIVCAIINLNKSIVSTQRKFPIFFSYLQILAITRFVFEKWHLYKIQVI